MAPPATPPRSRLRSRRIVVGAAGLVLLIVAGATAAFAYRGDIPHGTAVLSLDLGGKSRTEATAALQAHLVSRAARLSAPVTVRVEDRTSSLRPADIGLKIDVDATIDAASRSRPSLFASRVVEPVKIVDPDRLATALRRALGAVGPQMRMPAIVFDGTTPRPIYPTPGRGLDRGASADAVQRGWLRAEPIIIPVVDVQPLATKAAVDELMTTLARPAVAAPVKITSERGTLTINPRTIARSLILTADSTGTINPRIDDKKLRSNLAAQLPKLEIAPRDATMTMSEGKPRISAGIDGISVDLAAVAPQLLAVLPKQNDRTVAATLRRTSPKVTVNLLQQLGVTEQISTFTTKFPGGLSSPRSQNIVQIAKEVDGALVRPGAVFSLNGHTGERGYAQGYKDAPVILDGKLVPGVGGGASQFTTTLFNATYYAGMQDVEHKPHSYWFSRYPPVIESTIFYPSLDFKFKNNSPHGVLIDTSYTSDTVTVSVWSTKVYDKITTDWSVRRNVTSPRTIQLKAGPSCIATDGINGFTQDAWRLFHKDGEVVKREKFTWTYGAEPRYVCSK